MDHNCNWTNINRLLYTNQLYGLYKRSTDTIRDILVYTACCNIFQNKTEIKGGKMMRNYSEDEVHKMACLMYKEGLLRELSAEVEMKLWCCLNKEQFTEQPESKEVKG